MPILIAAAAALGLCVGSFLNVVIYRVPAGQSLVRPGSACPNCSHAVRPWHNVPLVSWLALRGHCADCAAPIAVRYPLVEAGTSIAFVAVVWQLDRMHLLAAVPAYLYFVAVSIVLAVIDLDTLRLPNSIVYPSYLALAALFTVAAIAQASVAPLLRAAIGAALMFAVHFAIALAKSGGMGMGDVKFAGLIGAALGFVSFRDLVVGALAAFVVGGIFAAVLLAGRRAHRSTRVAFAPAMVVGAFIALFAGGPISAAYLSLTPFAHAN
jgi:leader peptidase (prepilin peptidase) / N-methyltransferase